MAKSNSNELRDRVIRGNELLYAAWREACSVVDQPAEYEKIMARIDRAWSRLHRLCLELAGQGFEDCLYPVPRCQNNPPWFCYVCPSKVPHWREAAKQLVLAGVANADR